MNWSVGTASLAFEDQDAAVLIDPSVGFAAFRAQNERFSIVQNAVGDLGGGELGLKHESLPLYLTRSSKLPQKEMQHVLGVSTQSVNDLPEVAYDGDLPLEEDVRLWNMAHEGLAYLHGK